jgi:hypothetical protein
MTAPIGGLARILVEGEHLDAFVRLFAVTAYNKENGILSADGRQGFMAVITVAKQGGKHT